jgi:hypothetical protein
VAVLVAGMVLPGTAGAGTTDAQRMLDLINGERTARGLRELLPRHDLEAGAEHQAQAIADAGSLFHNPNLGDVADGWKVIGENVGYGGSIESVHEALMNSQGHRDNVLKTGYTNVGVGVVVQGGAVWVAEVFMEAIDPPPTSWTGSFYDDDKSVHEDNIERLASSKVTVGCDYYQFCPSNTVTRGQMAAFLNRAMGLPKAKGDSYTDDNNSVFEADIQALAEAGIAEPCGTKRYCPDDPMTREMMAVFLVRALDLPASSTDAFTDDNASKYQAEIQALAKSGITKGCGTKLFCPKDSVTREQMASFLTRAFGL